MPGPHPFQAIVNKRGFVLAPLLYLIALAGVAGAVLFGGYTQILRTNVEITADNQVRNQIRMLGEVLAAQSQQQAGPPIAMRPPDPAVWPAAGTDLAKRLPKDAGGAAVTASGINPSGSTAADSIGPLPAVSGARLLDPWGRAYLYCRWTNAQSPGTDSALAVLSAGADGVLQTRCADGQPASGSDDRVEYQTVANVMTRARTWQAQTGNTFRFGIDANTSTAGRVVVGVDSAHDTDATQQLNIGGNGKFGGNLTVAGSVTMAGVNAAAINATGDQVVGGALDLRGSLANTGTANGGLVAVNDGLLVAGTGASPAIRINGGTTSTPEIASYAASGAVPLRLASQGSASLLLRTNGIDQVMVASDGKVGIGMTPSYTLDVAGYLRTQQFLNLSDRRLKHDIAPLPDALGTVRRLRGVSFTWNSDGTPSIGVIAQEVEAVLPQLVTTDRQGLKAVMYANLVAPLIEAVKQLDRETDDRFARLEARLDALEAENAALRARLGQH